MLFRQGLNSVRNAARVRRLLLAALFALSPLWSLSLLPKLLPLAQAQAQSVPAVYGVVLQGTTYLDAASLRIALGDLVSEGGGILTWRGAQGVVTFFAGSADALLQTPGNAGPDDWALSAPVLADMAPLATQDPGAPALLGAAGAGWVIPLDAVQLLGVAFERHGDGVVLHAHSGSFEVTMVAPTLSNSGGSAAANSAAGPPSADTSAAGPAGAQAATTTVGNGWEATTINGVPALRFFSEPGKSLLLLDLDLAPLAFPEATTTVDGAVAKAGSDHALLVVVTSLNQQAWSSSLTFEQDGAVLETRHPYRLRVYQGDPDSVAPDAAVAAVVLLPSSFSLYRPLVVTWESIRATVTFRR